MSQRELAATARTETGKEAAKRLRRAGNVPGIAYGHKEEPVMVSLHAKTLRDMLHHGGVNGLISLQIEGGAAVPVIIKKMQKHPVTHAIQSIDFLRVSLDEKVHSTVPIHLEGEAVGVKVDGGILVQALHELQVEALPQDVPEFITVDVSALEFNGAPIHVREITMPRGVVALTDGDEGIAVVNPPDVEPIVEAEISPEGLAELEADKDAEEAEKFDNADKNRDRGGTDRDNA